MALSSKLTGVAGEYYVAFQLSARGFIVAMPRDGSPTVDILACNEDGSRTIAIQVKTTAEAERTRGRGDEKVLDHLEFPLGKASAQRSSDLLFAFVDLHNDKENIDAKSPDADVYFVPSTIVRDACSDWLEKVKWLRWHQSIEMMAPYKNNWKLVEDRLRCAEDMVSA